MLELRAAAYRYPSADRPAAGPLDLRVRPGELVLVAGPTGSGKSTLVRLASGLARRHGRGEVAGAVRLGGRDPAEVPPAERVRALGLVTQVPSDQLVAGTLAEEVALALVSAGWPREAVLRRVEEVLEFMGLPPEPRRSPRALSGGQQQRLVVGAAVAARPAVLLLDEPLAHLDPPSAADLVRRLRSLADGGVAVLLVEHRLEPAWDVADRLVVLDAGRVVLDVPPAEADVGRLLALGVAVPGPVELAWRAGAPPERLRFRAPPPTPRGGREDAPVVLRARGLRHRLGSREVLAGVDLALRQGEVVAVIGPNGAGKSTLLGRLSGRLRGGGVERAGRVVEVPQDPDLSLFAATVREEIAWGPREAGLRGDALRRRVEEVARLLAVDGLLECAPQALSRGQRLRVAVAAALAVEPAALLLDEPTAGQDRGHVEAALAPLLRRRRPPVLFATHDIDLALRLADRALLLDDGRIVEEGPPAALLPRLARAWPLPPLLRLCAERGLPPLSAAELARLAEVRP